MTLAGPSMSSLCASVSCPAGALDDPLNDLALRVGVVVDVGPLALGKVPLDSFVEGPFLWMLPQSVPEQQVAVDLRVVVFVDVQVHVPFARSERAMIRLLHSQLVAELLDHGPVSDFVLYIRDRYEYVHDGLGCEAGDGGRADVLDPDEDPVESMDQACLLALVTARPCGIGVDDLDRAGLEATHEDRLEVLVEIAVGRVHLSDSSDAHTMTVAIDRFEPIVALYAAD